MVGARNSLMLVFALLVLGSGVVGCSAGKVEQLEVQVRELKSNLTDLRTLQAQQSSDLNSIRAELRQFSGRMEEIQHVSVGKTQELEQTITQLKSRVPPPAGVPEDLLNQDEERIASTPGAAADLYRKSLQQIRTGDFDGALRGLTQFIQENPGTAFTDNALFWQGIAAEKQGQYDRAIVSYSEVFQKYPAEDMVPAALFSLAEAFDKLGSKSDAVLTLQKLVDEHPRSPYASKGRARLMELQGPPAGSRRRGR